MTVAAINARRTANRITNMRRMLAGLGALDMPRADIETFLSMSKRATCDMLDDLTDAGVLAIVGRKSAIPGHIGQPVYRGTGDEEAIKRCLASIEQNGGRRPRKSASSKLDIAKRDPSRTFHILDDDEFHAVKVPRASVMPDPWALPRPFFRSVGAGVEAA